MVFLGRILRPQAAARLLGAVVVAIAVLTLALYPVGAREAPIDQAAVGAQSEKALGNSLAAAYPPPETRTPPPATPPTPDITPSPSPTKPPAPTAVPRPGPAPLALAPVWPAPSMVSFPCWCGYLACDTGFSEGAFGLVDIHAAAAMLGMEDDTLSNELWSGQALADLAEASGADLESLRDAVDAERYRALVDSDYGSADRPSLR